LLDTECANADQLSAAAVDASKHLVYESLLAFLASATPPE
jgi:hypothetical protein